MSAFAVPASERTAPVARIESGRFTLGLQQIPDAANFMDAGRVYSISVKPSLHHVGLTSSILAANLAAGMPCVLVTPLAAEAFLDRCDRALKNTLVDALRNEQLYLFSTMGDCRRNIGLHGAGALLQEISDHGVPDGSLVVVDQAEQVFSLHHPEAALAQLDIYGEWLRRKGSAALFVFSRLAEAPEPAAGYFAVLGATSGNVSLIYNGGETALWVEFWRSGNDTVGDCLLKPCMAQTGNFFGAGQTWFSNGPDIDSGFATRLAEQVLEASDARDVYCLGDIAVPADLRRSRRWRKAIGLLDLIHATQEARAATVLIAAGAGTDGVDLARTVRAIRRNCGPLARIVILDRQRTIRYQNEVLLLRVGANAVAHDVSDAARLRLLLESMDGQICFRPSSIVFDDAVNSAMPPAIKGFLPPERFREGVREALLRARSLDLPCVMIIMNHAPADDLLSSVQRFNLSRAGDLLSACSDHCHVFLYGCIMADLWTLLPRLLGLHDAQSVGDPVFLNDESEILASLDRIGSLEKADCDAIGALIAAASYSSTDGVPLGHTVGGNSN